MTGLVGPSLHFVLVPIKKVKLLVQWMPVITTSLGIAYNVLITSMSDTMDIAYKNTLENKNMFV